MINEVNNTSKKLVTTLNTVSVKKLFQALTDEENTNFVDQHKYGRKFTCGQDFFVYRTQTVSVENLVGALELL